MSYITTFKGDISQLNYSYKNNNTINKNNYFSVQIGSTSNYKLMSLTIQGDTVIPITGVKINKVTFKVTNLQVNSGHTASGLVMYKELLSGTAAVGGAYPEERRYSEVIELKSSLENSYREWEFEGLSSEYSSFKGVTSVNTTVGFTHRQREDSYKLSAKNKPTSSSNEDDYCVITCTVEWDYSYKRPIITSFAMPGSVTSDALMQVNWSFAMPVGAENSFKQANLYHKKSTDSAWGSTPIFSTAALSGTTSIVTPSIQGTYYYTWEIVTQDSNGNTLTNDYCIRIDDSDNIQRSVTVEEIGNIGAPLNFKIGQIGSFSGTAYLGTQRSDQHLIFDWDPAADGTNNSVKSYTLFGPNGEIEPGITATNCSKSTAILDVGDYYVRAIGEYGYKNSNYATIKLITTPSAPSVSSILPEKLNESSTIEWSAVSKTDGVTRVEYEIFNNNSRLTITPETSFVLQRSMITAGVNNVIKIRTIAYAQAGTYSYSSYRTIGTTTKTESFTMPENFWAACYDSGNGLTSGIYPIAHKNIMFKWTAITTTTSAQGTIFNYELQYSDSETGVYQTLNPNNTTSVTGCSVPLDGVAEGTTRFYRVKVTNEFNQVEYSPIIRVTKIKPVAAENVTATSINYNTMQANFGWVRTLDKSADSLSYKINLHYNNQSATIYSETEMTKEPDVSVLNIPDLPTNLNNSALRTLTNLKTAVIANKLAHPTAQLEIVMWYTSFPSTKKSTITDIRLDYTTAPTKYGEITLEQYTDSNGNSRDYYNPGDEVVVNLNGFEWCDAAGNTGKNAGATVTTYLTSSYSTNKFIFTNNIARIVVPEMAEDETIVLTLAADVVYTDDKREFKSAQAVTVNAARWTKEAIYVDSIKAGGTETEIEGQLQLPMRLCSSSKTGQENLVSITPVLSKPSSSEGYNVTFYNKNGIITNIFDKTNLSTDRKIDFKITANNAISDITLTFDVIFVNTSNNELQVTAAPYRYFIAEVDLAIRKGRVGINVGKDYGLGDNSNATLQINAGSETGSESPIVEIFTAQKSTTDTAVRFLALGDNGGAENSISYVYKQNNKIFIDNLYHPPANSLTNGTLTLDFNNTGLILSGDKGGTILTEKNYSDYFSFNPTGAITTVIDNNLTANCVLVSNANGKISVLSTVSSTELGYLNGVTSAIQTQLDNKLGKAETAAAATKLETGRTLKVNLASTNESTAFTGESDIANIGVSGTLAVTNGGTGATTPGAGPSAALNKLGIVYGSEPAPTDRYEGLIWLKPKVEVSSLDWTGLIRIQADQCSFTREGDVNAPPVKYTFVPTNSQGNDPNSLAFFVGKITVNSFGSFSTMKITATCGVESQYDFAMFSQAGKSFGDTLNYSTLQQIGVNNNSNGSLLKYNFRNTSSGVVEDIEFTYSKQELERNFIEIAYIRDYSNYKGDTYFTVSFE